MMKVLVCGDRNWVDGDIILSWLCKLQDQGFDILIEGEARGADTLARIEAEKLGMNIICCPADWNKYGKAAGMIRNGEMLAQHPDLVLAFHDDIDNSKGTKDMVKRSKAKGIETIVVSHRDKEEYAGVAQFGRGIWFRARAV